MKGSSIPPVERDAPPVRCTGRGARALSVDQAGLRPNGRRGALPVACAGTVGAVGRRTGATGRVGAPTVPRPLAAALAACAGNQSRAAKMLGIPRRTFVTKLDAYRIPRPKKST